MKKKALITGITGQDGSYLAELLLSKGYEVHGIIRKSSSFNTARLSHLYKDPHEKEIKLFLHYGNLTDGTRVRHVIENVQPDEVYNLAAQSHVKVSFEEPEYTANVIAMGTLRLLDCVRDYILNNGKEVRFYQASSSEMFGNAPPPQNEKSPFLPRSPYAVSKVAAHLFGNNYRDSYGMFICNGILFNHESPRRGETFVTRKITLALTKIKMNLQDKLYLGNLDAKRDWGFAGDYVEAMWMMLQYQTPDDYVIATGESHSIRDFLDKASGYLDMDWKDHVEIDERYFRPAEVDYLCGDAGKAHELLGWKPKTSFTELVEMMVEYDLELARRERKIDDSKE
ncbi:MAG: GDP-mannose 4,6-dehydratase [Candidatus Latescibacteria bacterium]|jgi:GDPmannose 4,6-dehydratase|nr:GDP-mannose 4,6-dehydratase [Candidatus Latescibacterota bacterium]